MTRIIGDNTAPPPPPVPGPQGLQGVPGFDGDDGDDGFPGAQGLPGVPGVQGLQGAPGFDGDEGQEGLSLVGLNALGSPSRLLAGNATSTPVDFSGAPTIVNTLTITNVALGQRAACFFTGIFLTTSGGEEPISYVLRDGVTTLSPNYLVDLPPNTQGNGIEQSVCALTGTLAAGSHTFNVLAADSGGNGASCQTSNLVVLVF